jgi:hypothetical protein
MKRLVIHIGTGKAGSSTIQRFLHLNKELLAANYGTWIADENLEANAGKGFPIFYFSQLLNEVPASERKSHLSEVWKNLAHKMNQAQMSTLVVSAEPLSNSGHFPEFFESAKAHFKLEVIGYLRRREEWIVSAWKQWPMKNGISLEEYAKQCITNKTAHFAETFQSWKLLVEEGKIYIRPLLSQFLHQEGLARDFAEAAGIHHESLDYDIPVTNSTFNYKILSILQTKPAIFKSVHDNSIFDYLEEFGSLTKGGENTHYLSKKVQIQIHEAYLNDNHEIHRKFFPQLDYDEVFPAPATTEEDYVDMIQALSEATAIQFKMLQTLHAEVAILKDNANVGFPLKAWKKWLRSFKKY